MSDVLETQETILHNDNHIEENKLKRVNPLSIDTLVAPLAKEKNVGGRPPGSMNKATKDVKIAKKRFIERVTMHTDELFNAQLALAKGMNVLMVTRTSGKGAKRKRWTEMVDNPHTIQKYLDNQLADEDGEEYDDMNDENHFYFMTTRPPDNKALDSLLNRAFGKAPEKIEIEGGFFVAQRMLVEVVKGHELENGQDDILEIKPETEADA